MLGLPPAVWFVVDMVVFGVILVLVALRWIPGRMSIAAYLVCHFIAKCIYDGLKRRHRDYVFRPLSESELSGAVRRHFEKHGAVLEKLGFTRIGDFSELPWPQRSHTRYFLGPDRRVFAGVSRSDTGRRSYYFVSLLSDGTCVESSTFMVSEYPARASRMIWNCVPGSPLDQLYQNHLEKLDACERDERLVAAILRPEDVFDVAQYGHRLASWYLYQQGRCTEPPAAVRPDVTFPEPAVPRESAEPRKRVLETAAAL